ncbi:hypothetical protein ONE63_005800 [Megalurothrips usitatus]|uniref:Heat shock 70 kDa protein-like n=1 Tax=Megalurothrips usitatus TaxID=439358 RepID=A0AAV7XWP1_9NEOP|nr:hypothetical protein ONE63_005800 [Megalurothrips usitatus]
MAEAPPAIGIDLGTTYSVVSVFRKRKVEIIQNDAGSRTTPSYVAFTDDKEYVGQAAKELATSNTLFDSKRLLGRRFDDAELEKDLENWPFTVKNDGGVPKYEITLDGIPQMISPEEISSKILKAMKITAEESFGHECEVMKAVVTVPAYFNDSQRQATMTAGRLAGLEVIAILNEPTAAAMAFGFGAKKNSTTLIFDLGGGTFDVTVLKIRGDNFNTLAHGGDTHLGGQDFDNILLTHVLDDIEKKEGVRINRDDDIEVFHEIRAQCELVKRRLSTLPQATINVFLSRHGKGYRREISRAFFEDLCTPFFKRAIDILPGVLKDAGVTKEQIDEVVLVGGSTRIPKVRSMLQQFFDGKELNKSINPDEAVAHGAALHAAALVGDRSAAGNEVQLREEAARRPGPKMAPGGAAAASPRKIAAAVSARRSTGPPIGIDLGTTYSVVAVCRKGKVDVIANDSGSRTTPSVVAFLDGESFVGDAAKDLPASHRVFDAKRLLGRPWKDLDVQKDKKHWPFEVLEKNGVPRIRVKVTSDKETFAPEEISAMVLRSLKETAQNFLGGPVSRAVITVPAYFNERQRQATVDAGKIAGLEVMSIINEPTAAAIAYGLDRKSTAKRTIFIFDLGGGTFDVSVVTIQGSDFTVLASDGDTHLGGQDFDVRLMEHFLKDINSRHGISQLDMESSQELRAACELAKRKLSTQAEASTTLFFSRYNIRYSLAVTRARFEDLCGDLFRKAMDITRRVMLEAEVPFSAIDEVVLVGGSTRIPKVRAMLSELFGGKELRQSINPDEAVAHGAAVRAAVLAGDEFVSRLVQLRDVTPLSLGVSVVGDRFSVIIPRNSQIPCERTERYYTVCDYQTSISSKIYQGERRMVRDNHCLDKEYCVDVPAMPAGEAKVDVTFRLDSDGLLTVTCVEPTTGARQRLTISRAEAALGAGDVQAMVERAERLRGEDRAAEEAVLRQLRAMNLRV